MHDFDYVVAKDLEQAAKLMAENRDDAQLLAGGTDLIVAMRGGRRQPKLVIDAKQIPELKALSSDENGLSLGAAVSCRKIWESSDLAESYPALIESVSLIGSNQIQGRASVGGNLCNAAPSADSIPTLIAYGAVAHLLSNNGERQLPVEDVCIGPGKNSLADNELLVKLCIPKPVKNSGAAFLRFIPRNEMDIAVVNAASCVELDESGTSFKQVRIAIGAVAPTPLYVREAGDALIGKEVNDENINAAATIAQGIASPISDMRGTVEHRKQLVAVLVRRTLKAAVARARGEKS